jgi:hypothetical protein
VTEERTHKIVLAQIADLFKQDSGIEFSPLGHAFMAGAFEMMDRQEQTWLIALSDEDLCNVCIGETRYGANGVDCLWLVKGEWIILPAQVDKFLSNVHEFLIENSDEEGYTL